ncbi:uncharacterized protein LOC110026204 isoform X2 [Phalaenopsis equestris]|uniref:uncharacterized protein LOC110026204 isoform X2 n=1 Tax=Phalaenopsis equestris TaxID=78828 RepID=UPI0009E1D37A|nr:uncharacterized protein LOC110026204 isoform X2 [Phalaenopsis equestris]
MESTPQKSLERLISQRAMQMSASFHCKIWVLGFFCGVCITYLFLVAFTPYKAAEFGFEFTNYIGSGSANSPSVNLANFEGTEQSSYVKKGALLYSAWNAKLDESKDSYGELLKKGLNITSVPKPPYAENCKMKVEINKFFDIRGENGSLPQWSLWKGKLGLELAKLAFPSEEQKLQFGRKRAFQNANPPWVLGSDEDNFPLTREVQRYLWIHQHPQDCGNPSLRFLVADWERIPGFGIGAQLAGMAGLLAIAVNENRILVTGYYNRADHAACQGSSHAHWSCYFFPETSQECRDRANDLMKIKEAWDDHTITVKDNYTSKEIWHGRIPRVWGEPWSYLQPTTDINGSLLRYHRKMDRRWWRAQALRYLMRFQSEYTCNLLNVARHSAFGMQAAEMVLRTIPSGWPKVSVESSRTDIEEFVWSNHKPWIPRPILSMHVRMGDKACEMKVVEFENYMNLAERIRKNFPNLNSIWLSTEMQEVIDKSKLYPHWKFYYTNVTRQIGNMSMASYEASLGRETSTNYPLVNFIMATEADFFIGALGSTWCFLIDGMRNTGGKVMAGYLSVNTDRFW